MPARTILKFADARRRVRSIYRKIPSRRAEGGRRRVYLIGGGEGRGGGRGRALAGEKESREKGTLLEMTLLINAGRNGSRQGDTAEVRAPRHSKHSRSW